ncbi:Na+/H+ antiporter subunit E [Plantactinospora sp. GCM10030261]|uniref:Na+/H+ antiporter subunit E n=1 Tax=Plantactinospora sp. GCM10030261 TaxID=3273420 RepID=UPI0036190816
MSRPANAATWRRRRGRDLVAVAGLTLIWNLLWAELSWANLVGGMLVAVVVLIFFPLPPVTFRGRLRPLPLVRLAAHFVVELVAASVALSWLAIRGGRVPRSAVIAVPLRVGSDLNLSLTAELVSLVPGTLVVEVDRDAGILFVHVFDVRGAGSLAEGRRRIHRVEARLVRAVGSPAEVRRVAARPDREPTG